MCLHDFFSIGDKVEWRGTRGLIGVVVDVPDAAPRATELTGTRRVTVAYKLAAGIVEVDHPESLLIFHQSARRPA